MSKIALGMVFLFTTGTSTWLHNKQQSVAKLAPPANQLYSTGPGKPSIQFVPLNEDDISSVAALIVKGFDGEFPEWWQGLQKTYTIWNTEAQMEHRFNKFIMRRSRPFHLMTVAKDQGVAVGYVELGLVPINENRSSHQREYENEDDKMDGIYVDTGLGYPTIGNLVVDSQYRRQGVAMALMNHTIEEARKWGFDDIFCAVELDNTVAYTMYKDKLEFEEYRYERAGETPGLKKDRYLLRKRIGNGLGVKFEGEKGLGGRI